MTTQGLSWYEQRSPNTKAYENWLLKLLINSTVTDVAKKLQVKEGVVNGVIKRNLECQVDWNQFEQLPIIGIDEIALRKGHRNYVTLITAPTEAGVAILAVLKDRKQETVSNFLETIPAHIRETIECVCSDMYLGFINAVRAKLPESRVIVDRFHVAKAYRDCADKVRRKEMKRLRQDLSKQDYQEFKGAVWAFRRNPEELGEKDGQLLARLFQLAPKMEGAYELREELTEIFEGNYTKATAKDAIENWCRKVHESGFKEFDRFVKTAENWLEEITNYFSEGWSSGFVEGFNNRVKVLKRRCYGIFDAGRLFQRLSLDVNGYDRFGIP